MNKIDKRRQTEGKGKEEQEQEEEDCHLDAERKNKKERKGFWVLVRRCFFWSQRSINIMHIDTIQQYMDKRIW